MKLPGELVEPLLVGKELLQLGGEVAVPGNERFLVRLLTRLDRLKVLGQDLVQSVFPAGLVGRLVHH